MPSAQAMENGSEDAMEREMCAISMQRPEGMCGPRRHVSLSLIASPMKCYPCAIAEAAATHRPKGLLH